MKHTIFKCLSRDSHNYTKLQGVSLHRKSFTHLFLENKKEFKRNFHQIHLYLHAVLYASCELVKFTTVRIQTKVFRHGQWLNWVIDVRLMRSSDLMWFRIFEQSMYVKDVPMEKKKESILYAILFPPTYETTFKLEDSLCKIYIVISDYK